MPLGLLAMVLQRLPELLVVRVLLELRNHLEDRVLHLQRRAEFVDVELTRGLDRSAQ